MTDHRHVSAQRNYRLETHRHGKGRWGLVGPVFHSRLHAEKYARERGMVTREEAAPKSRVTVYRIVPAQ